MNWFLEIEEIVTSSTKLHCISCLNNKLETVWENPFQWLLVGCVIRAVFHGASLAVDGNLQSCWSEGVDGWGIGEFITISFDDVYEVKGFNIWTGHQKSQDLFYKNGRPAAIRVVVNGISQYYQLHNSMGSQQIYFPYPVRTNSVKIIIADVFKGYKYKDTCIAEVSFF